MTFIKINIIKNIKIGQFEDDRHCSKLRTALAKYTPGHILYEKNNISKESKNILEHQGALLEPLTSNEQMMNAEKLLRTLIEGDYFKNSDEFKWPDTIQLLLSDSELIFFFGNKRFLFNECIILLLLLTADALGLTPKVEYELALNSMGGILWCLKKCLIDLEILSMKNFEIYAPEDNKVLNNQNEKKNKLAQKYMVIDSITLNNLEVVKNSTDGSTSGTLLERLDYCNTGFG